MIYSNEESKEIAEFIRSKVILGDISEEYYYCHSSLCLLDAVYSVNSRYDPTVKNVIESYCSYYNISPIWDKPNRVAAKEDAIQDLVNHIRETGDIRFAEEVLKNKTKIGGKLKSVVILDLAKYFLNKGILNLQQLSDWAVRVNPDLFKEETEIFGIGSTTTRYLAMLAGNESFIKPDRHILRFLSEILKRPINNSLEAESLLRQAASLLDIPPRTLDNLIWKFQKGKRAE